MSVMTTPPLERGRAECEVAGPKDSFGGCVNRHARQHTPPPLSRGESHWPGFKIRLFHYFTIAKHITNLSFFETSHSNKSTDQH